MKYRASGASTGRRAKASRACLKCLAAAMDETLCGVCGGAVERFDSKAELRRYGELKLLERAGKIRTLRAHPRYDLLVTSYEHRHHPHALTEKVGTYSPDFEYTAINPGGDTARVIEDVKPCRTVKNRNGATTKKAIITPDAALRIKLFEALYSHKVRIVV